MVRHKHQDTHRQPSLRCCRRHKSDRSYRVDYRNIESLYLDKEETTDKATSNPAVTQQEMLTLKISHQVLVTVSAFLAPFKMFVRILARPFLPLSLLFFGTACNHGWLRMQGMQAATAEHCGCR